jgi:hypothetical protein
LVKDPFEKLVASSHPAVVADPLARVVGGRDEPGVGGEPVGAREGAQITHSHQELLGPEDQSHARKTNEDGCLRAGEKTLPELLVEGVDAILEGEHLFGEFGDDASGYLLGRQGNALGSGCGEGLAGDAVGSLDTAVSLG